VAEPSRRSISCGQGQGEGGVREEEGRGERLGWKERDRDLFV
jgi:hypothetical protein